MEANSTSLHAVMEFVREGALEAHLPDERISELDLMVEEVFMNVCMHAYPDGMTGIVAVTAFVAVSITTTAPGIKPFSFIAT